MLVTLAAILFFLWILGFGFDVLGMYIHILLLLAIVAVLIDFIRGPTTTV